MAHTTKMIELVIDYGIRMISERSGMAFEFKNCILRFVWGPKHNLYKGMLTIVKSNVSALLFGAEPDAAEIFSKVICTTFRAHNS